MQDRAERRMLLELLEDQLALNATLPRTAGALLFRPGHLTAEYVRGRIARYVPPFRLYLVTSVLFFILLPLSADANLIADQVTRDEAAQALGLGIGAAVTVLFAAASM